MVGVTTAIISSECKDPVTSASEIDFHSMHEQSMKIGLLVNQG